MISAQVVSVISSCLYKFGACKMSVSVTFSDMLYLVAVSSGPGKKRAYLCLCTSRYSCQSEEPDFCPLLLLLLLTMLYPEHLPKFSVASAHKVAR